ncbi:MAG: hypothetical protein IJT08_01580, partial [Alphaproteobacteria bacterium]|nr:hypothetical protein [Alphaproteobacteria bacterium]
MLADFINGSDGGELKNTYSYSFPVNDNNHSVSCFAFPVNIRGAFAVCAKFIKGSSRKTSARHKTSTLYPSSPKYLATPGSTQPWYAFGSTTKTELCRTSRLSKRRNFEVMKRSRRDNVHKKNKNTCRNYSIFRCSVNGGNVYVNFAHTSEGLCNALGCFRRVCGGQLICVFGCGGDRDKSKRPEMGKIAA